MPTPRSIPPFQPGDNLPGASTFEAIRKGVKKRIRGMIGSESSTSAATDPKKQSLREYQEILNNTGKTIPKYSIFAVKKSGEITYPWGLPVRTEAFDGEANLYYMHNGDFDLADGNWYECEAVGELPIKVRYKKDDGEPKIGHPIGPLDDMSVSIKRCGYVVIAEPDVEEETVWIVKSNDQMIRVKLIDNILPNERGSAYVVGEMPCHPQCTDQELRECSPEKFPDPNDANSGNAGESTTGGLSTQNDFILREILNISGKTLSADQVLTAHPTLGLGYTIFYDNPDHFKAEAIDCHYPEEDGFYYLWIYDVEEDQWVRTGVQESGTGQITYAPIKVQDKYGDVMLLPGQLHDVKPSFNSCGATTWNFVGQKGLTRQGKVTQDIECFARGQVDIIGHELSACDGQTYCSVVACNGTPDEEGRRKLFAGETVTVIYFESTWKILPAPMAWESLGELTEPMCPDDEEGEIVVSSNIDYCLGATSNQAQYTAVNFFGLSGPAGATVLLGSFENTQGERRLFIKQVQHYCKNIAITEQACAAGDQDQDQQQQQDLKFMKYEDCKIQGYVLEKSSVMSCADGGWQEQIELHKRYYMDSANFGRQEYDDCNYGLVGYMNSFCTFDEFSDTNTSENYLGATDFKTTSMYDELQLAVTYDDVSGEVCANPKLVLKGRERQVLACDECDEEFEPSGDSGGDSPTGCTGSVTYEWYKDPSKPGSFPFAGRWDYARGHGQHMCSCSKCSAPAPTHNPTAETTSPLSDFTYTVECTCTDGGFNCCEGVDDSPPPTTPCEKEEVTSLRLEETTAYHRVRGANNCIYLVPHSFVVFSECGECSDTSCDDELICANPCPETSA